MLAELGQILGVGDEVVVVAALLTPASRRLEVACCWRWPENVWMGVPLGESALVPRFARQPRLGSSWRLAVSIGWSP